jgi:lipid A disaccharide synthetase
MMLMTGIPDQRTAMYCAGAISRLWAWGDTREKKDAPHFQHMLWTLPEEMQEWLRSWGYRR